MKKTIITGCEARGDADPRSPYLTRYTLVETKWFQVCVHLFHRSDHEDQHDHPWNFCSLILWNGYFEHRGDLRARVWPMTLLYRRAEDRHRVELLPGKKAVTLVIMGRRTRMWGFWTKKGWQSFVRYFNENKC